MNCEEITRLHRSFSVGLVALCWTFAHGLPASARMSPPFALSVHASVTSGIEHGCHVVHLLRTSVEDAVRGGRTV